MKAPVTNTVIGTYVTYVWTDNEKYFMWASLFYFFWVVAFTMAATQYVLSVAVCSWYFTENSDNRGDFSILRGYHWLWRYNIGSILFGSFLVALVYFIRVVFEYIHQKMKKAAEAGGLPSAVDCLMNAVKYCLVCCQKFI